MNFIALKDITDVRDGTHDTPTKLSRGIKLITSRQLKNNQILQTDYFISNEDAQKVNQRSKVDKWDILITMIGTVGDLHLVRETPDYVIKNIGLIKTAENESLAKYLFYYLQSHEGQAEIKARMSGTSQQFISLSNLRALKVNLPSPEKTQAIVDKLDVYNCLIENNSTRIKKLESMARLLYRQNIGGADVLPLSEVTSLISRGISPRYDDSGNSLVINQRCIRDQKIDLTLARLQSKPVSETRLIRNGDILINSTGVGTLGRVAQVFGEFENTTVDSHVSIVRPNGLVDPYFFGAALLHRQEDFERRGTGATGQTELSRDAIGRVAIELPSLDIQKNIGEKIKAIRGLVNNLQAKNSKLSSARDLLLPQLMSGRLEI